MEIFEHLGAALGLASLAGINLYLTAFVAGLAIRFNWIDLAAAHEGLAVLGNEWVLVVAGVLMVVFVFVIVLAIAIVIIRKTFGALRAVWRGMRKRKQQS